MRCYVEFIAVPTADTPGTLLVLHFDDRRYLIGQLSEGSTRACAERAIGLRKVSDIFLTGKTEWANVGGLLGMVLSLADNKTAARAAAQAADLARTQHNGSTTSHKHAKASENDTPHINIYGAPNLNHLLATSRRFIFRTGMPLNVHEFPAGRATRSAAEEIEPTWKDNRILVWAMPILPSSAESSKDGSLVQSSKKRVFEETSDDVAADPGLDHSGAHDQADKLRKSIVKQMFDSSWRYDRLVPQQLSSIQGPAACFVRDPLTNKLTKYNGPMPGGTKPVPDITVLAREPWPGAATAHIPPTQPAPESLSYIIRNYPQRGKFMPQKAKEFGITQGLDWSRLANGDSLLNSNGDRITPEMVLQPGKQGGGLAVVDLPSSDYVGPLVNRPEWQSDNIMDGVEAIVWILGPGVIQDKRLEKFQQDRPHIKHIVSSPECCPNVLALEKAATNALRHNLIDNEIFPTLEWDGGAVEALQARTARPGQVLTLEPRVDFEDDRISPPFDPNVTRSKLLEKIQSSEDVASALTSINGVHLSSGLLERAFDDIEIVVLGTGSSHPSTYRNVSGTLIRIPGWGSCLLDCGEGTLNTLKRMFTTPELENILVDLKMIWISHMHADHHLGLTSVVKAWNVATRGTHAQKKLAIVSTAPMLHWLHEYSSVEELGMSRISAFATSPLDSNANDFQDELLLKKQGTSLWFVNPGLSSDLETRSTTDIINELDIDSLNTVYVNHCRGAQAISMVFRSGFKISYSGDCRPNANFTLIGRGSHVLIHEATLEDDMRAEAIAKKHSTAGEALIVASEMQAKICLLTHFSQRYPTMPPLGVKVENDAAEVHIQQIEGVLEEEEAPQPDVGIAEDENQDHSMAASNQISEASSQISNQQLEVIDENDIRRLIEKTGLKVLFAFDYMRLKLKDVPRLELKQPVLRKIYSLDLGKDIIELARDSEMKEVEDTKLSTRERKRREKQDRIEAEKTAASARRTGRVAEPVCVDSEQPSRQKIAASHFS